MLDHGRRYHQQLDDVLKKVTGLVYCLYISGSQITITEYTHLTVNTED